MATGTANGLRRFRAYPKYKDSDVEWLGEIPEGWDALRLRFLVEASPSKREIRRTHADTEVSFVPMDAVGEYGELDLSEVSPLGAVVDGYTYFRDGDVVVAKITPCFENGKGAVAEGLEAGIGLGTTELHILRPSGSIDGRFLFYLTISDDFRRLGTAEMQGAGGQKRVPEDFIRDFRHPLPRVYEQRAIAAFLDRETAKIDALIAKKERLIELLQEKRAAVITQAVTQGLRPKVKLVASGHMVFPEIPHDWKLLKLRRLIRQVKRPVLVEPETEYREIGIRSWGKGIFHKDGLRGALLEDKKVFYIEPGDLVLNIVFAWEGAVAVVSAAETGMVASHRFPTFRHSDEVELDYLLMSLQCQQGRALMGINSPGAAGRNRTIRLGQFREEEIPLPPLVEQREIVRTCRIAETRIDALAAKVGEAIDRMEEVRTALISAAVTGKIDVRQEVA